MSEVVVHLNVQEASALGAAVLFRIRYLAALPSSLERDEELAGLRSCVHKIVPQVERNASQARSEEHDRQN